jgi:hypothetical protein
VSANPVIRNSLLVAQYIFNPTGRWEATGGGFAAVVTGADSLFGYVKHRTFGVGYSYAERRFTLGTQSPYNALPLKLIYWTALPDGNKVRLNWQVEQEQDIDQYDVERSSNGTLFGNLMTVPSLKKASWLYTGYDMNPIPGWNYYRLKITDRQNKITYTDTRKVKFNVGIQMVNVFPNPARDVLHVIMPTAYTNKVHLQLFSDQGQLISSFHTPSNNITIPLQNLAAGNYVLKILHDDGRRENHPFVKQ